MNSKEKAKELIEKLKVNDYYWIAKGNLHSVKQHALISVDELIKSHNEELYVDCGASLFWQEVKKEIEKL